MIYTEEEYAIATFIVTQGLREAEFDVDALRRQLSRAHVEAHFADMTGDELERAVNDEVNIAEIDNN